MSDEAIFYVLYSPQLDAFHINNGIWSFCIAHRGGVWRKLRSIKRPGKGFPTVVAGKESWCTRTEAIETLIRRMGIRVGRVVEDGQHWRILPETSKGPSGTPVGTVAVRPETALPVEGTEISESSLADNGIGLPPGGAASAVLSTPRKILKKPKKILRKRRE